MRACYLDASAIVKLAILEMETDALREHLARYSIRATSRLAAVEVPRALARKGPESVALGAGPVAETLQGMAVIELDDEVVAVAAALQPPSLRSLDAIHLASALSIGADLDALVTYDARMADAAAEAGLTAVAPT